MPVTYSLAIFVALVIFLSLLRERLVYELAGTSLLIFGTSRPGILFYSVIFLPGTIIHELSHWLMAEILRVKTGEIAIFPDFDGKMDRQRLGSVATAQSDPFRGFLIGVAPFLSGLLILGTLGQLLVVGWGRFVWWQIAMVIYGIIVIGNSMMTSKEDRRTWPFIIILLTTITYVFVRANLTLPTHFSNITSDILSTLNLILGVTTGINLVMIGGSYALRKLVERVSGKRITNR